MVDTYSSQNIAVNNGRIITKVTLPTFDQPLPVTKQCLGNFFIAYVRDNTILNSNCLETSPTWMHEMQETIQDVPLTHVCTLIIPYI